MDIAPAIQFLRACCQVRGIWYKRLFGFALMMVVRRRLFAAFSALAMQRRLFAALSAVALGVGFILAYAAMLDAFSAAMRGYVATRVALLDAFVGFGTSAAMPEVDAATLWDIDRGLAFVGLGPINAKVFVGTLLDPDFANIEFESGMGQCGLPVWCVIAAALLGAALSVTCRAAMLKCFANMCRFFKFAVATFEKSEVKAVNDGGLPGPLWRPHVDTSSMTSSRGSAWRRSLPSFTWTEMTRWRPFLSWGVTSRWKRYFGRCSSLKLPRVWVRIACTAARREVSHLVQRFVKLSFRGGGKLRLKVFGRGEVLGSG